MPLTNPTITPIPASPDPDYPSLTSITVADLVGPVAANRQPNELAVRNDTLRDGSNELITNMNEISTGGASGDLLFLPRDGALPMSGAIAMGANKITGLDAGTAATDASNVTQVVLRNGTQAMTGTLDMGSNKIIALADPNPANPAEALNIGFADGRYQAGKGLRLLERKDITTTSSGVTFTGLDGNAQNGYVIMGRLISTAFPVLGTIDLRPNGVTINLLHRLMIANTTGAGMRLSNGVAVASQELFFYAVLQSETGGNRFMFSNFLNLSATVVGDLAYSAWNDGVTNITSLEVIASNVAIANGSYIALYAIDN